MKKLLLLSSFVIIALNVRAILVPVVDSIPMSDDRKLAADIYIPAGMSNGPVILIQTPYNRQISRIAGLPLGIGQKLDSSKYIFVITDWRGFYGSFKAAYIGSPDRTDDGYSTVEWIASQSWSNGKVGTWGPSALGKVQFQTAKRNPPHLVCICPSVAAPQFDYNEYYPNGALRTEYVEQLDQLEFGLGTFILAHPFKDNAWNFVQSANDYADSIKVPCFMVGGWYDHNTQLMLDHFEQLRLRSFFTVRNKHKILMGPWVHGGNGAARVGTAVQGELSYPNAENKNDSMSLQFFDFYLRNISNGWDSNNYYIYYQMGENVWQQSAVWPPSGTTAVKFYLNRGTVSLTNSLPGSARDSISYTYNPADPSPTIGGPTLRSDLDQGPYDQSNAIESRSDNLSFTSRAFTQNVVLKGNIKIYLKVSSDKLDTDFDIRICDVYPDGKSMLVNDGVMRMRFRNGFTAAETAMMVPGQIYDCVITMPATAITFLSGHSIRIIISSSNYPRFNRNQNNGGDMYPGNSTDSLNNPQQAINTVFLHAGNASYIELPLLNYTSSVNDINSTKSDLSLYPNPAVDRIAIHSNIDNLNSAGIQISDLQGRVYRNIFFDIMPSEIEISDLPAGIYIFRLENSGMFTYRQFIVIR